MKLAGDMGSGLWIGRFGIWMWKNWGGPGVRVEYSKCKEQDEQVYRGNKWRRWP